ncbi:MAG: T9SS type A sorting domain-containing protein [Cyclobacteriaceae bacterium]|nr:T9SS type A sorting domain-containing protein [Cyclobacteriaceae bacterium]
MNKHGEYFWIELTGLTPGIEYAFRYLVDESIHVADPFADKILDPDDQYISSSTYPSLKPFPTKALRNQGYENRVSVLQTNQTPYAWQTTFVKPPKENLVIYELLIRDFFDDDHRNYQALIDTIAYFKRLGINAIELMPIMEFNGNEGWGYNPTFMFAPDKYYGTKNKLKEFIDTCHANDIAVILDIAMNHQDVPNPFALMYFEFGADGTFGKPAANNPWFNRNPRHPYNVFFDLNHSSTYTQAYLDTVTHYWLNEYRVDGYRFDLSKGFTQNNNCGGSQSDEGCFGNTDNSRITILRRMADKIWSHTSDAVIILEHFASNTEEKALAEYRAGEGKGMMLWGNLNYAYAQNTMGYTSGSDVNSVLHSSRNWTVPHLVGYMESHDEERVMYKNLTFGEEGENYSVLSENIALQRMTGAGLIFLTLPGPKMMWQFAELGYDKSINLCENGTNNSDCRLSPKPPGWIYQDVAARSALYSRTADMLRLRNEYGVFTTGTAAFAGSTTLQKQVTIRNSPYTSTPASTSEMNVHVVTNFDVVPKTVTASFPHAGSWFEYYTHSERLDITTTDVDMELLPGEYRLYTDVAIENPLVVGLEKSTPVSAVLYPNPVKNILMIEARTEVQEVALYNMMGMVFHPERINVSSWNVANLSAGMYIAEIRTATTTQRVKVVKD